MLFSLPATLLLSASLVAANPVELFNKRAAVSTCANDDCARAVTGTTSVKNSPPRSSRSAECMSALGYVATTTMVVTTTTVYTSTSVSTAVSTSSDLSTTTLDPSTTQTTVTAALTFAKRATNAVPSYAASACRTSVARYSSACSCFSFSTTSTVTVSSTLTISTVSPSVTSTTTTVSSTVTVPPTSTVIQTVSVTPTPPANCDNSGLEYGFFPDNDNLGAPNANYDNYDPTVIKGQTPSISGRTQYIYYAAADGAVYGQSAQTERFSLEHRGYIYASVTGTYSFAASNIDDIEYMWLGAKAYSGWTKANRDQYVAYDIARSSPSSGTFTQFLVAGTYTPFRLVYKQGPGGAGLQYTITDAAGTVILNSDKSKANTVNPYVVAYSCDGTTAPAFPAYAADV